MFGISIYFKTGLTKNLQIISEAIDNEVSMIFTSLHIPEENLTEYIEDMKEIAKKCKDNNISLIADISPHTLKTLGVEDEKQLGDILLKIGIDRLRIDFGIENDTIIKYSHQYKIMINASTINESELYYLIEQGLNVDNVIASHNFYPKINTGVSEEFVRIQNDIFREIGIKTIAFIPGDKEFRHPFYEKLPTCEAHRNMNPIVAAYRLKYHLGTDYIFIGDINSTVHLYSSLKKLEQGVLSIKVSDQIKMIDELLGKQYKTRYDNSPMNIRLIERTKCEELIIPRNNVPEKKVIEKGSIIISNSKFGRYAGEIEIVRLDIPYDERYNIVGKIDKDYHSALEVIDNQIMIELIK